MTQIHPNKGGNVIESNDIYNKNNYSSSSGGSPFKNLNDIIIIQMKKK